MVGVDGRSIAGSDCRGSLIFDGSFRSPLISSSPAEIALVSEWAFYFLFPPVKTKRTWTLPPLARFRSKKKKNKLTKKTFAVFLEFAESIIYTHTSTHTPKHTTHKHTQTRTRPSTHTYRQKQRKKEFFLNSVGSKKHTPSRPLSSMQRGAFLLLCSHCYKIKIFAASPASSAHETAFFFSSAHTHRLKNLLVRHTPPPERRGKRPQPQHTKIYFFLPNETGAVVERLICDSFKVGMVCSSAWRARMRIQR